MPAWLIPVPVEKEALAEETAAAEALVEGDYTAASWTSFAAALANAKAVIADENATQEAVDAALAALATAKAGLETAPPPVDKEALAELTGAAEALNEAYYTADSWASFATALASAKAVLADGNATQFAVDAAVVALTTAKEALVIKPDLEVFSVTADKDKVAANESFNVSAAFTEPQATNAAILKITFDSSKFDFKAFYPAAGVETLMPKNVEDDVWEYTVMSQGYNTTDYGYFAFTSKEGIDLNDEANEITVEVTYVLKNAAGEKAIYAISGSTSIVTGKPIPTPVPGDTTGKGYVDLIDLSNVIDMFGYDTNTPNWDTVYKNFDFNNNGVIDIYDVVFVAQQIK
jgi:hypothetical protein